MKPSPITPILSGQLILEPSSLAVEEAILQGYESVAVVAQHHVSKAWPGSDWLEVLPSLIETYEEHPDWCAWNRNIVHREDNTLIGCVGCICPPQDEDGAVSIGYYIVPEYRRQGFAREAVTAYVEWLKQQPAVKIIKAECLVSNTASVRILERAGLKQMGLYQDAEGLKMQWELVILQGDCLEKECGSSAGHLDSDAAGYKSV